VRKQVAELADKVAPLPQVVEPQHAAAKELKIRRRVDPPQNTDRTPIEKLPIKSSCLWNVKCLSRFGRPLIPEKCERFKNVSVVHVRF
jgi:hypothetical protein